MLDQNARFQNQKIKEITSVYGDGDRVYKEVMEVLQIYSKSIKVRNENYTFDDGVSAVLLCCLGTIPVLYRNSTYNIPVKVWIPYNYPQQPPLAFVTPTSTMVISPSQNVDSNGKLYLPNLKKWWNNRNENTILDLMQTMQELFSEFPPVRSKPDGPPVPPPPQRPPPSDMNPSATPLMPWSRDNPRPNVGGIQGYPPTIPSPQSSPQGNSPAQAHSTNRPPQPYYPAYPSQQGMYYPPPITYNPQGIPATYATPQPIHQYYPPRNAASPPPPPPPSSQQSYPSARTSTPSLLDMNMPENQDVALSSLKRSIVEQLEPSLNAFIEKNRAEVDKLERTRCQLLENETNIIQEESRLQAEKVKLSNLHEDLCEKEKLINRNLELFKTMDSPTINSVVVAPTPVHEQIFELSSKESTIEDMMYYLAQAFSSEHLEVATYMKHIRGLAKELFMCKALQKKVVQVIQHQ